MILVGNETYALEPVPQSTTNEHLLYLLKDIESEPVTCGVVNEAAPTPSHEPFEPSQSLTSLLRVRSTHCVNLNSYLQCEQVLNQEVGEVLND